MVMLCSKLDTNAVESKLWINTQQITYQSNRIFFLRFTWFFSQWWVNDGFWFFLFFSFFLCLFNSLICRKFVLHFHEPFDVFTRQAHKEIRMILSTRHMTWHHITFHGIVRVFRFSIQCRYISDNLFQILFLFFV